METRYSHFAVLVFSLVLMPTASAGPVPADCMACMCQAESNCRALPCALDGGTDSCGPYQIKDVYYTDARLINPNLGSDWRSCTLTFACSEKTVQAYMTRYATVSRLGHSPTCEDFARIHNGGPNGYRLAGTVRHWNRVNTCLNQGSG